MSRAPTREEQLAMQAARRRRYQVAERTRRSQAHVSRYVRLLRYPLEVQAAVGNQQIGIFDALSIPTGLLARPAAMKTLPASLGSARTLRQWIQKQISADERVQYSTPYTAVKVSQALGDRVKAIATQRRIKVFAWVEEAINEKLKREGFSA